MPCRALAWPTEPSSWLTPAEQWLRRLLILLTVVFIIRAIGYEAAPLLGLAPDLVRELPFVTNSVVKVSTLAMLCGYVAQAMRPRMALVGPIIAVHFVSVVARAIYLLLIPSSDLAVVYTVAEPRDADAADPDRCHGARRRHRGPALQLSTTPPGPRGSRVNSSARSNSAPSPHSPR